MILLTPPAAEPVTVDEAKQAARISGTAFDGQLPGLIAAARELAEQDANRWFIEQTQRQELRDWPASTDVLPVNNATACAVSYWNGTAWANLAGAAYVFAQVNGGTALAPNTGTAWPTLGDRPVGARVRIDLTAGAEDATGVEEAVKLYIKACVAFWIDNPSAVTTSGLAVPLHLRHLLDRVRVYG